MKTLENTPKQTGMKIKFQSDHLTLCHMYYNYKYGPYSGWYIRRYDGRWYRLDLQFGQLYRMKYAGQVKRLNELLEEATSGRDNEGKNGSLG